MNLKLGWFYLKQVMANLYSAHMDPAVWEDPHKFNPERFLDAHGNVTNKEAVISFSMGLYFCLSDIDVR